MRIVVWLAATLMAAAAVLAASPGSSVRAQDAEPSLVDLEAEYLVLASEADALGRGRTINESIRFSQGRQSTLRQQIDDTSALLRERGVAIQELAAAVQRFANSEDVSAFEDLAGEAGQEVVENIAEAGLSQGLKRAMFGIGVLLDVVEENAERYVRYANRADLLRDLQAGRVQHSQIAEMIAVMNAELQAELRAEARLKEILPEQRRLFDAIAEERRRQNLLEEPAAQHAAADDRLDDAIGDEQLATASLAEGASRPGPIAGRYETNFGILTLNTSGGAYTSPTGRIVVTSILGSVMEGCGSSPSLAANAPTAVMDGGSAGCASPSRLRDSPASGATATSRWIGAGAARARSRAAKPPAAPGARGPA